MRKLFTTGVFSLAFVGLASAQFNDPPALENRNGSMGFQWYMLEVPDDANMVADGSAADWDWWDSEYTIVTEEFRDEADRPSPTRDDLSFTLMQGWKGGDVNRYYFFLEIWDDTLHHHGTNIERWEGEMIEWALDPQDHGRELPSGYNMEWLGAPGDLVPPVNVRYRWLDQEAWGSYADPEYMEHSVTVDPPEAWAAEIWPTGGTTVYEVNYVVLWFHEDGGPSVSPIHQLDTVAGEDGDGLPFSFWIEDGDSSAPDNDFTSRGPEASARQYYSHALLLRTGEYVDGRGDNATAIENSTWGQIKHAYK
jgi:hypothetical protein